MNVVEQRIWHSVIEGDFEKLPGQGKPLKLEGNPHMDPAEDLAFRILHQNGFAPEWVELNKEIRFHMERWRRALRLSWKRKADPLGGDAAPRQEEIWRADLKYLEEELNQINKKVCWTGASHLK
jgi:DnaJ family protein C protein 28